MLFVGHAAFEHHHTAHRRGPLYVGDVIALDPPGRVLQPERFLQLGQGLRLAVAVSLPLGFQRVERFGGVLSRHPYQIFLHPAARDLDLDLAVCAPRVEPLLDDVRFLDLIR